MSHGRPIWLGRALAVLGGRSKCGLPARLAAPYGNQEAGSTKVTLPRHLLDHWRAWMVITWYSRPIVPSPWTKRPQNAKYPGYLGSGQLSSRYEPERSLVPHWYDLESPSYHPQPRPSMKCHMVAPSGSTERSRSLVAGPKWGLLGRSARSCATQRAVSHEVVLLHDPLGYWRGIGIMM